MKTLSSMPCFNCTLGCGLDDDLSFIWNNSSAPATDDPCSDPLTWDRFEAIFSYNARGRILLIPPLAFKLGRGQMPQRRVNPFMHVHVIEEATDLTQRVMVVPILFT